MELCGSQEIASLDEFQAWIERFQKTLKGDELILLSGEMGAGKTEFVKRLSRLYGIADSASPTFALHHAMRSSRLRLDHFDLYRLESLDELETLGLWEILEERALALIEWPERVPEAYWPLTRTQIHVQILHRGGGSARHLAWQRKEVSAGG